MRLLTGLALLACVVAIACSDKAPAVTPSPPVPNAPAATQATGTATATATGAPATATATARPTPTPAGAAADATPPPAPGPRLGAYTNAPHTRGDPAFAPLSGARAVFGRLGDAVYRIEIPAAWNGELVVFAHGVRLDNSTLIAPTPPAALRNAFIQGGFAWASSSYSENQYVPGIGADDTLALASYFASTFGPVKRTYLVGESMGGHVLALLMEHYPTRFDGALSLCGAIGGEEEIDFLISWALVAEFASGVPLPLVAGTNLAGVLVGQVAPALGSPDAPTAKGKQFLSIVRELTGGPRPFFLDGLRERYTQNFGLLLIDPGRQSVPAAAATNLGVRYGIAEGLGLTPEAVDSGVRRLQPDAAVRDASRYPDAVPTTGLIERPILSLHTTGDLFVPISLEVAYRRKVEVAGRGGLLVQRAIRDAGHCKFSDAELTTAWKDLAAWVRDGRQPAGDDLLGDLSDIGRQFTSPLRAGDPGTP